MSCYTHWHYGGMTLSSSKATAGVPGLGSFLGAGRKGSGMTVGGTKGMTAVTHGTYRRYLHDAWQEQEVGCLRSYFSWTSA